MGKLHKGVPGKGAPARWSWGDDHIIEKPPLKKTKVSCLTCKYYETEENSCLLRSIGPGDGIDHWKRCKEFILNSDYDTYDNHKKIQQIKGISFFNQMMKKKEINNNKLLYETVQKDLVKTDSPEDINDKKNAEQTEYKKEETASKIELTGQIYIHKTKGRCVIK